MFAIPYQVINIIVDRCLIFVVNLVKGPSTFLGFHPGHALQSLRWLQLSTCPFQASDISSSPKRTAFRKFPVLPERLSSFCVVERTTKAFSNIARRLSVSTFACY